jgi:outer membrane lipoprotein-sorting protein
MTATRRDFLVTTGIFSALALAPRLGRAQAPGAADAGELQRIETYLNNIRTLQSRFTQLSSDGGVSTGTLWLSRPGKMRVEYDPPVPVLLVASDERIWYYDKKLQQVSFFDLKDTPAWFLLQPNVRFGGDITVFGLQRGQAQGGQSTVSVTVSETKNPQLGRATLAMNANPLELRKWQIVDAQQKVVTVTLDDPHYGVSLNPQLFYWTDPRPPNARPG